MAIYPLHTTTIINEDVLISSPFKAGMALMLDSNGRAIKADSQQLISNNIYQKYGRFLGFAASDHDISGNTIIIPDVIGSNYLDNNYRFIKNENTEYSVAKRALIDLQDTAVSNFYNASDTVLTSKRGIGVYNTPGDYFITDQFLPVLHGDYGFDNTTIQTINPGDLLTFGGGINAGKLVKVNVNSFGPDVVVVASVEKYIVETGLLYFKQVNYGTNFTNLYLFYTDPGNTASYNGGTALNNVANLNQSFTLENGPIASSFYIAYDGTNDQATSTSFSASISEATFIAWVWRNGNQNSFTGIISAKLSAANMVINGIGLGYNWNNATFGWGSGLTIPDQTWSFCAISINSALATACVNGVFSINNVSHSSTSLTFPIYLGTDSPGGSGRFLNGRISQAILINKSLTQTELTNYYNATRGRYGV
jgi:hypothetical protein